MDINIEDLLAAPIKEKFQSKKESNDSTPIISPKISGKKQSQVLTPNESDNSTYQENLKRKRYRSRSPRDRHRSSSRTRSRSRRRSRDRDGYRSSRNRSSSRRRSYRSRSRSPKDYYSARQWSPIDYYRRRESPERKRRYSPERSRYRSPEHNRYRSPEPKRNVPVARSPSPVYDAASRDNRTVFCMQLAARLTNAELRSFLSPCGKIREVRMVQDKVSRRSKGVAYVEFYSEDSVPKAIGMSGQKLLGIPILIHSSESEKNRVGEAAVTSILNAPPPPVPTHKIFVGCLNLRVTEKELKDLFEKFGEIDQVKLHMDSTTGRSKGFAYIEYFRTQDAREAIYRMNDYELHGKRMHVMAVNEKKSDPENRDLDEPKGLSLNAHSRLELMSKLARDDIRTTSSYREPRPPSESVCILLKNMFDLNEETSPNWEKELKEDVRVECEKHGKVRHMVVDSKSRGHVYIKFDGLRGAKRTCESLNGRYFEGRKVSAVFFSESMYYELFPYAAKL